VEHWLSGNFELNGMCHAVDMTEGSCIDIPKFLNSVTTHTTGLIECLLGHL
jgi:hypothetical protein